VLETADVMNVIAATCGVVLLALVWLSVLRTTLIPRRSSSRMARWTVRACAAVAITVATRLPSRAREWVMQFCAPVSLFVMAAGWLLGLLVAFGLLAVSIGGVGLDSGALLRFFALDTSGAAGSLALAAAMSIFLVLVAFVAYLVHFMDAYRRRERMIIRSAKQVHRVTDADHLLADFLRNGSKDSLDTCFAKWADWLADIHDSHASYPGLVYQRSSGTQCWAKTALIVMDAAALVEAVAPNWAPLHTKVLLDVGSACLQDVAKHVGVVLPVLTVSLHGREERAFGDTMRLATDSGLPAERDLIWARTAFQEIRVRYAPYAVLIGSRLLSPWHNGEID
jgi:hypothetical protein